MKQLKLFFEKVGNKVVGRSEWIEPEQSNDLVDSFYLFQSMRCLNA